MAKPIVQQGGVIPTIQAGRDGKLTIKHLRRIYTDAVEPNGNVPNEQALDEAVREAIAQTKGQDIDGYDFKPLSDNL